MKASNGIDLQSQKITNLADPSANTDAANKQYVDNTARGLQWKIPARVATTANGTLATAYANGQSVDGVTLVTGDRILLKDQTAAAENGIYTVDSSGAPTRATDADTGGELAPGTAVSVNEGTANGDKVFHIISDAAITIGTTSQTWAALGGGTTYTGSNGVNVSGSAISGVAAPSGGLTVGGTGFAVDTTIVARKASGNIGNGSLTSIPFTHSLGTKDIVVAVRDVATDTMILCDWVATDTNTATLTFAVAPTSNQYRVSVIG